MIMGQMRIIYFNGSVDEVNSLLAIVQLLNYNAESKTEPIYMYINSPGGSVPHGLAIYDTIKHINAPVYTICTGMAASMGSFLLSCGEKGHRSSLKHSSILIHQPLVYLNGGASEKESGLSRIAHEFEECRDTLEAILAENTNQPLDKVRRDCERDNWMSAEEALEYGLIDSII